MKNLETMTREEPADPGAATFPHLAALIDTEEHQTKTDRAFFIINGYMPSWAQEHHTDPDRGLKEYSTATRWNAYKEGRITREKACEYATIRAHRDAESTAETKRARLRAAATAPALDWLDISVEWVRNRYWGDNPHATARAATGRTEGKAGGCGYDKRSAAVGEALNQNPAALAVLYRLKEAAMTGGATINDPDHTTHSNAPFCGYGGGYGVLPYYEGGVGVSCFWSIFRAAGYTVHSDESGKHYDHYSISREGVTA